ncbi:hypothetical protein KAR91_63210 [Candidatus Pacearchaeota archaeon]|nr:hypothetical protein [Candidatus Pacearchaeota archaeon]
MKPIFGKGIIILLMVIFLCITVSGIHLVYKTVRQPAVREASGNSDGSTIKVEVSKNKVSIDIISTIPGIFVFIVGGIGLILLLIKVPVKRIVEYQRPRDEGHEISTFDYGPALSKKTEKIPWLLWRFIKSRGLVQRVRE